MRKFSTWYSSLILLLNQGGQQSETNQINQITFPVDHNFIIQKHIVWYKSCNIHFSVIHNACNFSQKHTTNVHSKFHTLNNPQHNAIQTFEKLKWTAQSVGITTSPSSLLEAIFLPLIEQISFCTAQIHNLGAPIPIFLLLSALFAIVGIWNSYPSTDNTPPLKRTVVAFITNPNKGARAHVWITYHTFAVVFLTQPAYGYSWLLAAHY